MSSIVAVAVRHPTWSDAVSSYLRAFIVVMVIFSSLPAHAADASPPTVNPAPPDVVFRGQGFYIRNIDPKKDDLRLFWKDDIGNLLRDFHGVDKFVASHGEHLLFGANAGMYEPDSRPCGLLVQDGAEKSPLNLNDGDGNFYMKPNGVFVLNAKHEAHIVNSTDYVGLLVPPLWATQSGPLLVHGGEINPDFNAESKNRKVRSGVGVRADGTAVLALSRGLVTFYEFAEMFRSKLQCPNALFLDGDISAFYEPGRPDPMPHSFGPMLGIVGKDK